MKAKLKTISILLIAILAGVFTSCMKDENITDSENSNGKGTVKFFLTDAPFPSDQVAEANITIDKIVIHMDRDSAEFITVSEENMEFNLLELRNGITAELSEVELESGTYDQIRLHLVDANIVLNDEDRTTYDLKIPSGTSSGLKINIKNGLVVTEGSLASVLLDFDVSKSFVVQGNPKSKAGIKGFIFKPVIRAVVEAETGGIEGHVSVGDSIDVAGANIGIYQMDSLITSSLSDSSGYYAAIGLPAGSYNIKCTAEGYDDFEANDISVLVNESTTANIQLQPSE